MAMTASAGGRELSQRLAKIETAISRRKTIQFSYYTMERDATMDRKVDPYHLVFRSGQFYLIGYAHERDARPRLPALADPGQGLLRQQGRARLQPARQLRPPRLRVARRLADGREGGHGADLPARSDRLAGRARLRRLRADRAGRQRRREARQGLGLRDRVLLLPPARRLGARLAPRTPALLEPPELATEAEERRELLRSRHSERASRPRSGSPLPRSPTPSAAAAPTARPRP